MRRGFTLIELMAASLLLAMLVTVLTMIFNQSSIAWRTGIAGVASLGDARRELGTFHEVYDDLLPGLGDTGSSGGASDNRSLNYRTVSVFQKNGSGLRPAGSRAYDAVQWGRAPSITIQDAMKGAEKGISAAGEGISASLFTVGVRSAGPDGIFDTKDDITTWPENAN